MKRWKKTFLALVTLGVITAVYGAVLIRRGFSTFDEPSAPEKLIARTVRNLSIPPAHGNKTIP
jgi:hypothetical protein